MPNAKGIIFWVITAGKYNYIITTNQQLPFTGEELVKVNASTMRMSAVSLGQWPVKQKWPVWWICHWEASEMKQASAQKWRNETGLAKINHFCRQQTRKECEAAAQYSWNYESSTVQITFQRLKDKSESDLWSARQNQNILEARTAETVQCVVMLKRSMQI